VPTGRLFSDCERINTLAVAATAVSKLGNSRVKPAVYFMPTAKMISKTLAIKRYVQAMAVLSIKNSLIYDDGFMFSDNHVEAL
jgi:hypothetical protein